VVSEEKEDTKYVLVFNNVFLYLFLILLVSISMHRFIFIANLDSDIFFYGLPNCTMFEILSFCLMVEPQAINCPFF